MSAGDSTRLNKCRAGRPADRNVLGRLIGLYVAAGRDLIFPPECSCCRTSIRPRAKFGLCEECLTELCIDSQADYCHGCGTLSLTGVFGLSKCPECEKHNFRFDDIVPLGIFRGQLREAMIRVKHPSEAPLINSIALLTANRINESLTENRPDIVVIVPKHWLKRMIKGTSGVELLGEEIARFLDLPFFPRALHMTRNIRKQSLLSVTERARNVRGALKLSGGYDIGDAHVLLVDDTMTTGATADEAAAVLKRCGAYRVTVAVAARASNLDTLDAVDLKSSTLAQVS